MSYKMETFQNELLQINNSDKRLFVAACLESVPSYFFKIGASSSGKYHPMYCVGEGGLVRHTKAAIKIAIELMRMDMYSEMLKIKDEVISALILHDCVKNGIHSTENGFTVSNHPLQAVQLIRNTAAEYRAGGDDISPDFIDLICELISTHMGQWRQDFRTKAIVLPEMKTESQKFVHLCDYLASRKCLTVTEEDGTPIK